MSASGQDPSDQLAYAFPCGFCGGRPTLIWLKEPDNFVIGCEAPDCSANPRTESREGGGDDERVFAVNLSAAIRWWDLTARRQRRLL